MAISKYSKRVYTTLNGNLQKEFLLECIRDEESESATLRKLVRAGLEKVQEDRLKANRNAGSVISKFRG